MSGAAQIGSYSRRLPWQIMSVAVSSKDDSELGEGAALEDDPDAEGENHFNVPVFGKSWILKHADYEDLHHFKYASF